MSSNAQRLIEDAKVLSQYERYRAGYIILLLASEELGKAIWLRIGQTVDETTGSSGGDISVILINKQRAYLHGHRLINGKSMKWRSINKRIADASKRIAATREKSMYVDFDFEKGKFVSPLEDNEIKKDFNEELRFAEWLWKWLGEARTLGYRRRWPLFRSVKHKCSPHWTIFATCF